MTKLTICLRFTLRFAVEIRLKLSSKYAEKLFVLNNKLLLMLLLQQVSWSASHSCLRREYTSYTNKSSCAAQQRLLTEMKPADNNHGYR